MLEVLLPDKQFLSQEIKYHLIKARKFVLYFLFWQLYTRDEDAE